MIVAVSADENNPDAPLSSQFDNSRCFVLFDADDKEWEVVENPYADSLGDAGIQSAQVLIKRNVDAVITDAIGENAFKVLSAAGVPVFRGERRNVKEVVGLFLEDRLEEMILPRRRLQARRRMRFGRSH
jgi:predicted Fe-Mo cluster-binding NifX family protein